MADCRTAQPTRYGTSWWLPARKPTVAAAMRLLELPTKPQDREHLRRRLQRFRDGPEGPWGASCGTPDEWVAVQRARDAYLWLWAQLPSGQEATP